MDGRELHVKYAKDTSGSENVYMAMTLSFPHGTFSLLSLSLTAFGVGRCNIVGTYL